MFLTVISEIGCDQHITQHELDSVESAVMAHNRTRGLASFFDVGYTEAEIDRIGQLEANDLRSGFVSDHGLEGVWIWTTNRLFPDLPEPFSLTVVRTKRNNE